MGRWPRIRTLPIAAPAVAASDSFAIPVFLVGADVSQAALANEILRVGRDRRYALRFGGDAFAPVPGNKLIDLETGVVTNLSQFNIVGDGRQCLADNGVVRLSDSQSILLGATAPPFPLGMLFLRSWRG